MADSATTDGDASLEHELEEMLSVERFEPPAEFRAQALLNDPEVYERARRDPQGWWAEQAGALDWSRRWDTVPDGQEKSSKNENTRKDENRIGPR